MLPRKARLVILANRVHPDGAHAPQTPRRLPPIGGATARAEPAEPPEPEPLLPLHKPTQNFALAELVYLLGMQLPQGPLSEDVSDWAVTFTWLASGDVKWFKLFPRCRCFFWPPAPPPGTEPAAADSLAGCDREPEPEPEPEQYREGQWTDQVPNPAPAGAVQQAVMFKRLRSFALPELVHLLATSLPQWPQGSPVHCGTDWALTFTWLASGDVVWFTLFPRGCCFFWPE